jgi:hypothetical protein
MDDNYILSTTTMLSMDPKTAVMNYQYGERAKSELILMSQLSLALTGFSEQERAGGKKMLLMMMESVRSEIAFAEKSTEPEEASRRIAAAISAATTPAQEAWQVLSEHGLL